MSRAREMYPLKSFDWRRDKPGTTLFCQTKGEFLAGLGLELIEGGKSYRGTWEASLYHGKGQLTSGSQYEYIGELEKGKMNGLGRLRKKENVVIGRFNFETLSGFGLTIKSQ